MQAFCTYCSRDKNKEPGKMPAIYRYLDTRIEKVYSAASQLGLGFYILSGEFGLLPPQEPIPWYDHLLRPEEVENLADRMTKQILEYEINGLVYFTKPCAQDSNVVPYHDAIVIACSRVSRPVFVVELRID